MGLKDGIQEILEDFWTFRTVKVVKISDRRLAYVHKSFMIAILVYSLITMIGTHTYMLKEKPQVYVSNSLDDSLRLVNFTNDLAAGKKTYCNTSLTDFPADPDVIEGGYLNNKCSKGQSTKELARLDSETSGFIATHQKIKNFQRVCPDADVTNCYVLYDTNISNSFAADVENIIFTIRCVRTTTNPKILLNESTHSLIVFDCFHVIFTDPRGVSRC